MPAFGTKNVHSVYMFRPFNFKYLNISNVSSTISSIYAVSVYAKFHLRGIWIWSHSSIYALISPLFTLFWVKNHSNILFTRFFLENKKLVNGGESLLLKFDNRGCAFLSYLWRLMRKKWKLKIWFFEGKRRLYLYWTLDKYQIYLSCKRIFTIPPT